MEKIYSFGCIIGLLLALSSCNQHPKKNLFEFVDSDRSHLEFANTITENDSVNPSDCLNCFNGGGVGIGDFNNDGFEDIYFSSNLESNKLYINRGNFEFEDYTAKAGVDAPKKQFKDGSTIYVPPEPTPITHTFHRK